MPLVESVDERDLFESYEEHGHSSSSGDVGEELGEEDLAVLAQVGVDISQVRQPKREYKAPGKGVPAMKRQRAEKADDVDDLFGEQLEQWAVTFVQEQSRNLHTMKLGEAFAHAERVFGGLTRKCKDHLKGLLGTEIARAVRAEEAAEEAAKAAAKAAKATKINDGASLTCIRKANVYRTPRCCFRLRSLRAGSTVFAVGPAVLVPIDPCGVVLLDSFRLLTPAESAPSDVAAIIEAMDEREARLSLKAHVDNLDLALVRQLLTAASKGDPKRVQRTICKAVPKSGAAVRRMKRVQASIGVIRTLPEPCQRIVQEML